MTELTLERQTLFEGTLLTLEVQQVQLPDGRQSRREIVYHPDAVCAVVVTPDRQTVLVRQYRKPVEGVLLEVPAGKIDPGEDPDQAILRELHEEVGMTGGRLEKLLEFYCTPGFCTESLTCYLVHDAVLGEARPDDGEFIEPVMMPLEDALKLTMDGSIRDAKSITSLLAAARRLGL